MARERTTVEATAPAPIEVVWNAYTLPEQVTQRNFASDHWHCPEASVDLREGGKFTSRMEAKDGSMGFDFGGTYTGIAPNERIEYAFGDRVAVVEFIPAGDQAGIKVSFDPDSEYPTEHQRSGWDAILEDFCRHVATR